MEEKVPVIIPITNTNAKMVLTNVSRAQTRRILAHKKSANKLSKPTFEFAKSGVNGGREETHQSQGHSRMCPVCGAYVYSGMFGECSQI